MVLTRNQAVAAPEYWDDRTDIPDIANFNTVEEWQQAVAAFLAQGQNATPQYAAPTATPYDLPGGGQGTWYAAGSSNQNSAAVNAANRINAMLSGGAANTPDLALRLASMLKVNPDMVQMAYEAVGPNGEPLVLDPLLALLESLGVRPGESLTAPPATGQPGYQGGFSAGLPGAGNVSGFTPTGDDPNRANPTFPTPGQDRQPPARAIGSPVQEPTVPSRTLPTRGIGSPVNPPAQEPVYSQPPAQQPPPAPPQEPWSPPPGYSPPNHDPGAPPYMEPPYMDPGPQMAQQMVQQFGNASTIHPGYPDWLLNLLQQRQRPTSRTATGMMGY